ncbi:pyrimidine reductase family protein [Kitasatospora sp. NPDC052896]|uniref:pyrimidine reductase family protein n=1 Tax=Kitasatospora sp. NPDC052896 TaxID=3364061 RepID=UPI0037C81B34
MRRLFPAPGPTVPAADRDDWLAEVYRYPRRSWLRASMVRGLDGAAALRGRSGGLSGPADAELLAVLRSLADVVLVGAGTARAERYGPAEPHPRLAAARTAAGRPPAPPIAVVSARLRLDPGGDLFGAPPDARTLVLTTRQAPASARRALERVAEVLVVGEDEVEPRRVMAELADRGLSRVLCEGGPQLLGRLCAAGLLDELCLTVAPLLTGGDATRILRGPLLPGADRALTLTSVLTADDYLFTRYLLSPLSEQGS